MAIEIGLVTPSGKALVDGTGKWLVLGFVPLPIQASAGLVGQGALFVDADVVRRPPPPAVEFIAGKYRPLTWPSYGRPWRQ